MSPIRLGAICLALALSIPGIARATGATCNDFYFCFENPGAPCNDAQFYAGLATGAVDGTTDLLCFVGDPKCRCLQSITDPDAEGTRADEWAAQLDSIIQSCGDSASGGRSLSGVAFEAATTVCTPGFAEDVAPILDAACGVCHVTGASAGFSFPNGRSDLVNVPSSQSDLVYVLPGDPESSYLWHKIAGTQASVGGDGTGRMPAGMPLPPEDSETIRAWILGGALP